jgi:ribonuclease-3
MTEILSAQDLEKLIEYKFLDPTILEEALTRRAFRNENPSPNEKCMDLLATLGDAVLDAVVICRLYENGNLTKGELTECKKLYVERKRTQAFAEDHKLSEYIQWGKGELMQKNWTQGNKALDTVTEALIGAVYLDAQRRGMNGMIVVEMILERMDFFNSVVGE